MFGTEDKYKKFNDDVAKFLQNSREKSGIKGPLSENQITGAEAAKNELLESKKKCPLMTLETRNSIIKKHLFESSEGIKITSEMIKAFNAIALGG
tara:strand:- start:93 stop:377 length:285 start_codon:yes stop_codon:yes gene_type:complete